MYFKSLQKALEKFLKTSLKNYTGDNSTTELFFAKVNKQRKEKKRERDIFQTPSSIRRIIIKTITTYLIFGNIYNVKVSNLKHYIPC